MWNSRLAFLNAYSAFMWCIHIVEMIRLLHVKICVLSDKSDFLSIAVHAFASRILISFSVDEALLPRYVNLFTNFREPPFSAEMSPSLLKHTYSVLSALRWRSMPLAARSRLCSRDSAWVGVFARSAMSSA